MRHLILGGPVRLISNEIGLLHQDLARRCRRVWLMVAGIGRTLEAGDGHA
jgi:adenosyl cobinamide kinase/adenosyl cobinamide phosphate guanylyltransferase